MAERLADVLAGLSRFADIGFGLPPGTSLRSAVLAARLARVVSTSESNVSAAYWTALLQHVGCVGYAHETAQLFGDELRANAAIGRTDPTSADGFQLFVTALTNGASAERRQRVVAAVASDGQAWGDAFSTAACEVGRDAARRLGLAPDVQNCLLHAYDLWADETADASIPFGARVARVTGIAALFSAGGTETAMAAVRARSGGLLDPDIVDVLTRYGGDWLTELATADARDVALAEEPSPHVWVPDLHEAAAVFGDLADLKSPCFTGHSRHVAGLSAGAARIMGLSTDEASALVLAGHLHDVGRIAVSSGIWDKPGPLSTDEWEQVRLHPYQTERILSGSPALAHAASIAGRHHERLDGSGYHRGSRAPELSPAARILAVAECFATACEPRPHRATVSADRAAKRVQAHVREGRLDADAAHAVLGAAGRPQPMRRPGALSPREIEVLRLLAYGAGNPEIAQRLTISRRTAEHHVQHVYAKIGVSSRAAATLYAVEHHLVDAAESE